MNTKKLQFYFFIALLLAVLGLSIALFRPFIAPIALAFMVSIVVRPVDTWFLNVFKRKRTLAALLTVVFVAVVILVPLSVLVQQITVESLNFYSEVRGGNVSSFNHISTYIVTPIQKIIPDFDPDVAGTVKSADAFMVSTRGQRKNKRLILTNLAPLHVC